MLGALQIAQEREPMNRPVMNPSLLLELDAPPVRRSWWGVVRKGLGLVWKVLLFEPFAFLRRQRVKVDSGTPFKRLCRGVLYRVLGLPFVVAAVAGVMVFNGTHPPIVPGTSDPQSVGIYHDPVTFLAEDGTRLEAWYVPAIDAKRVIEEKEAVIRKKSPAVVLVHDYGATREQMLPLVRPLHEGGYIVLVVSLRGSDSKIPAGQTFGLNEAGDVRAAVDSLRRRPGVDGGKVALIGVGTGATASLLAAKQDSAIAALVLDHPLQHSQDILARIGPQQWWLGWMRPTCKWTFDLAYGVDAEDVDAQRLQGVMKMRPSLMLDNGTGGTASLKRREIEQMVRFLHSHVPPGEEAVAGTPKD